MDILERLDDRAIKAFMLAGEESRRLGHELIGPEQILWALIVACDEGSATTIACQSLGLHARDLRHGTDAVRHSNQQLDLEPRFTPGFKQIVERALAEAVAAGKHALGPDHLSLALLDGDTDATTILASRGLDPAMICTKIRQSIQAQKNRRS